MTIRPMKSARQWFRSAVVAALGVSAVVLAMTTDSATMAAPPQRAYPSSLMPQQIVFPRAGVSSEAYRTRPALFARQSPSYQNASPRSANEPGRLVHAAAAQQIRPDSGVVPVQHQFVEPTGAGRENRQSVRAELERLYAEEDREMPQMAIPRYPPQPPAGANPATARHANPPSKLSYRKENSDGLLSGLFDFGRKDRSRSSSFGMPMRPPAEPRPFQPPTYRQQQPAAAATQARQTPSNQLPTAAQRQATAQATQSADVFTLRKGSQAISPRNFKEPAEGFFPDDSQGLPTVESQLRSPDAGQPIVTEDHESFFPLDAAADNLASDDAAPDEVAPKHEVAPKDVAAERTANRPADIAANSMKARMKELLNSQPQESADEESPEGESDESADGFKMPALAADAELLDPPAAPAAVSEIVTTEVASSLPETSPREPAPFFAAGERAIDPQEQMDVAALTGQTFEPSGADSEDTAGTVTESLGAGSQMQQIAARAGKGLKGFCPVALRDERALKDGRAAYVSFYRSKAYYFSSMKAKAAFDANPRQYAPAADGQDVTMKALTGEVVEGTLDHSVWYQDRLYLFHSAENLATFMAAPSAMAVVD